MAGDSIRRIQSNGIASTIKHYALNARESSRNVLDARLDARLGEAALRERYLLAFQIGIERGQPGSVMWGTTGSTATRFAYGALTVTGGDTVRARFTVTSTGTRAGADVPQFQALTASQFGGWWASTVGCWRRARRRLSRLAVDPA